MPINMTSKPVIIFVPGAWHPPSCFAPVMDRLEAADYETKGVELVSVGPAEHIMDFKPDVEAIQAAMMPYCNQGKDILMVVHSYGGMIGSEAVRGFEKTTREKEGKKGGLVHIYFCCAFCMPVGMSLIDGLQGKPLPWFQITQNEKAVDPATPIETFYNDVEDPEPHVKALKTHSYQTFFTKLSYPGYKYIPRTYLVCEKDMAIPLHVQKAMIDNSGVEFRVDTVDASHSPFISVPDEMAMSIRRAAGEL